MVTIGRDPNDRLRLHSRQTEIAADLNWATYLCQEGHPPVVLKEHQRVEVSLALVVFIIELRRISTRNTRGAC